MRVVCCGCLQEISADDYKDVFDENLWFSFHQTTDNSKQIVNAEKRMKLREGVEIITGHKISRTNEERPIGLCNACFEKVESYINFRARLLSSLGSFYDDASHAQPDTTRASNYHQKITTSGYNDLSERLEDVINVDENSTPLDFKALASKCSNDEESTEVSTSVTTSNARLPDHCRENNHRNVTDDESSEGDDSHCSSSEVLPKIQENDIESEIDVCSGEDDEVLELDGHSKRDEIVEIGSSSESDIEVCDYEPTGKRIKNYNALSPPILF